MDNRRNIEALRSLYFHCLQAYQLSLTLAGTDDLDPDIRRCVAALPLVAECTCSAIADGWHLQDGVAPLQNPSRFLEDLAARYNATGGQ